YWATNAPFSIFDGSALRSSVTVNQRQSPVGTTIGGSVFQTVARVTITSGTLKVILSNNANGYVMADAIRAIQLPPPDLSNADGVGHDVAVGVVGQDDLQG